MLAREARLAADGSPLMSDQAVQDLRAHAIEAFPDEAVGAILADGSYQPLKNIAPEPEKAALLAREAYLGLLTTGQLRSLVHSHPRGPDAPSETDMRSQIEMAIPFVIVATNGQATAEPFAWGQELLDERPLIGRPFRHAVDDCYELVRAHWLLEFGVRLPSYPRNWEWWLAKTGGSKDLYRRFFADAGFYQIGPEDVRPNDCFLAAVRSPLDQPNHAGVFLDGGLALHHVSSGRAFDPGRLSKREPMARWMQYVTHWLRRD